MATEGGDVTEYDPRLLTQLGGETVRVLRAFSFAGAHVVIVGGLVPSLLVPDPEEGFDRHVGTQDLDLCLSLALIEGDTANYARLEKCLKDTGFQMAREDGERVSWRWQGGLDLPLTVEFFCPSGPGREPGRLYRPGGVVGGRLSAMVLEAGRLIDRDVRDVEVDVELPAGGGRTRHTLRVVGPAAYLAAKADALVRRNKNKDAYDVVWLVESWPGGQSALAVEIRAGSLHGDEGFVAACGSLEREFATLDSAGAIKYARFMTSEGAERDAYAQRAVGAIQEFLIQMRATPAP